MIEVEQKSKKAYQLNSEAEEFVKNGSHEANIFAEIPDTGIAQADLMVIHTHISLMINSNYFFN